jgi:hypothetical protein
MTVLLDYPEIDPTSYLNPPDVAVQDDGAHDIVPGFEALLSRAIITRDKVADNAHFYSTSDYYFGYGQCLKFSRMCAQAPGGVYDADASWAGAKYRHTNSTPPRGTFPHFAGGNHGHVTVSEGGGWCWTTDYRRYGRVDLVPISYIVHNWGMPLRGWTEDINGVHPLATGDWFDMATAEDLDNVVQARLLKFVDGDAFHDSVLKIAKEALDSGAGVNMVREGVQQELGDENVGELSNRIAAKVWATEVTDPTDNQKKTMKTIVRYSAHRARRIVESLGGTYK